MLVAGRIVVQLRGCAARTMSTFWARTTTAEAREHLLAALEAPANAACLLYRMEAMVPAAAELWETRGAEGALLKGTWSHTGAGQV